MSVSIKVPGVLRPYLGDQGEVSAQGATLREAIDSVDARFAGFKARIVNDAGQLNHSAVVYVNEEDVRHGQKLDTPLKSGDEILIVPMAVGGR